MTDWNAQFSHDSARHSFRARTWALVLALVAAGAAALAVDVPLARWLLQEPLPRELRKLFDLAEVFSYGTGVVLLLVAVAVLDPRRRRTVPRVAAAALGAGLAANALKLLVARTRPRGFDFDAGILASFTDWLPGGWQPSSQQAFPSSHAATAAGLALALAWLYPRGRWLFAAFAALACGQRLVAGAHFASDVLWGSAVGVTVASFFVAGRGARWFARWEHRRSPLPAEVARPAAPSEPSKRVA